MDFEFADGKLEKLYTDEKGARGLPPQVVDAFFEVMAVIASAPDERDLREQKHLHYEKLKGRHKHQSSLALHRGFRLVVRRIKSEDGITLLIEEIVDYHKG